MGSPPDVRLACAAGALSSFSSSPPPQSGQATFSPLRTRASNSWWQVEQAYSKIGMVNGAYSSKFVNPGFHVPAPNLLLLRKPKTEAHALRCISLGTNAAA